MLKSFEHRDRPVFKKCDLRDAVCDCIGEVHFNSNGGQGQLAEDSEIVRLFARHDEAAVDAAKQKYGEYLGGVARGILHDARDAEECVNDALLAAWEQIPAAPPANLKAYLKTLTRNICVSRVRSNSALKRKAQQDAEPFDELEELLDGGDVAEQVEAAELAAAISQFLRGRKADERNIFIRRYWFGDSVDDIAKRFGLGQSKVKMTLKRTRDRLRDALRKEGHIT